MSGSGWGVDDRKFSKCKLLPDYSVYWCTCLKVILVKTGTGCVFSLVDFGADDGWVPVMIR